MRKVILFDLEGLLDLSSPNLCNEATNEFIMLSPKDMAGYGWSICCDTLHDCQQYNIQLEFWFLFSANNDYTSRLNNSQISLNDFTFDSCLNEAPTIIQSSVADGIIKTKKIIWVSSANIDRADNFFAMDDFDTSDLQNKKNHQLSIIYTRIKNKKTHLNLEKKFLLPMSIIGLKYQYDLVKRNLNHNPYTKVTLEADESKLITVISSMRQHYSAVYSLLHKERDKKVYNIDGLCCYSLSIVKNITIDLPNFQVDHLNLGLFYKPYLDEQEIERWFQNEVQKTLKTYQTFSEQLKVDYESCLAHLNSQEASIDFRTLAKDVTDLTKVRVSDEENNRKKIAQVKEKMQELMQPKYETDTDIIENSSNNLKKWYEGNIESLVDIVQLRPTSSVVLSAVSLTLLLAFICILFATNNPLGTTNQNITFLPIQVQYLLSVGSIVTILVIALSVFLLLFKYNKYKHMSAEISSRLSSIHKEMTNSAQNDIDEKSHSLLCYMLGKNINHIENLEKSLAKKIAQYNFAESQINSYIDYLSPFVPDTNSHQEDNINATNTTNLMRVNPFVNLNQESSLQWCSNFGEIHSPSVYQANTPIDFQNPTEYEKSVLNKLAGTTKIEFI